MALPIPKSRYKGGKLLSYDPDRGVAHWVHFDPQTRKHTIEEVWDNKPVLKYVEGMRQLIQDHGQHGDLRYVGSASLGELQNWMNKGKIASGKDGIFRVRDQKWVTKKLNDPANRKFNATK